MKIFFTTIAFFISTALFAQGNLQFNQVLTYGGSLTVAGSVSTNSTVWTVPSNKVWKIERKTMTPCSDDYGYSRLRFFVNSNECKEQTNGYVTNGPIWLKAGDNINFKLVPESYLGSSVSQDFFISIIEFNIVP